MISATNIFNQCILKHHLQDFLPKLQIMFEIRLFVINKLKTLVSAEYGWSVFTRYYSEIADEAENEEVQKWIFKLRMLNHKYSTSSCWQEELSDYLKVEDDLRIYNIADNGTIIRKIARIFDSREEWYEEFLNHLPEVRQTTRGTEADILQYENGEFSVKVKGKAILPESLPAYREKKYMSIRNDQDWNLILSKMGDEFSQRPAISMQLLKAKKELELQGLIHIVGPLGAGKSIFKHALIYDGVINKNMTFSVIEESVAHVIETTRILRRMGINAVPYIGSTSEEVYLKKYINKMEDFNSVINDDILAEISGSCIVKACAGDANNRYPCTRLKNEFGRDVVCSYAGRCGHLDRFRKLSKASVIVSTPHALIKSTIHYPIEIYNRSLYEIMYDISDTIVVDEADGIQRTCEELLMVDKQLNYGNDSVIMQFEELSEMLPGMMNDNHVYRFVQNINMLHRSINVMERILGNFSHIEYYLRNKRFVPTELRNEVVNEFEFTDVRFKEELEKYVELSDAFNIEENNLDCEVYRAFNLVQMIHATNEINPETEMRLKLQDFLNKYKVSIKPAKNGVKKHNERVIEKLGLLIMLVQLDYLFKQLCVDYMSVYSKVHQTMRNIDGYETISNSLIHLIKEPCMGTLFGYKLKVNTNRGLEIDILRYDGVGRDLITNWTNLKKELGLEGPAVICLSGTSYAPKSAHYNINKEPDALLLGKAEGKIEMHFLPKINGKNFIRISGAGMEKRSENLISLTKSIVPEIKYTLRNSLNRKILIVANSYDDCKTIENELLYHDIRCKCISNDERDNMISRENIENFPLESDNADVCIVPLSIIARGYNILDEKGDSYFGTMFIMVRPYMVPGDFGNYIQILHFMLGDIEMKAKQETNNYSERVKSFRKLCYSEFSKISNMTTWNSLSDPQRDILSWYMMVQIKQAIGRMQRNGNDCAVYFCDIAFCDAVADNKKPSEVNSTLHSFLNLLDRIMVNNTLKILYGNFAEALREMLKEIDNEYYNVEE